MEKLFVKRLWAVTIMSVTPRLARVELAVERLGRQLRFAVREKGLPIEGKIMSDKTFCVTLSLVRADSAQVDITNHWFSGSAASQKSSAFDWWAFSFACHKDHEVLLVLICNSCQRGISSHARESRLDE